MLIGRALGSARHFLASEVSAGLVGRTLELAQLREYIDRRQHALVVGPVGVGKSALLAAAAEGTESVLRISRVQPLKPALLSIAQQLHAQGRLELPDLDSAYLDWTELQPQLNGLSTAALLERLVPLTANRRLFVDDFDGITPALARLLEPLFETTLILGAITTVDLNPELSRFFWHFRLLPLEPLSREAARELLWQQMDPAAIPNPEVFERHVLDAAGGNPLAIRELVRQAQRGWLRHPIHIQQLHHEAGIRYVDLTPLLLVVGACAVIARFMALGLNDIEGYILAGSFGACFLVGRYFIYRAMRSSR